MTSKTTTKTRQRLAKARAARQRRDDRRSLTRVALAALAVTAVVLGVGYLINQAADGGSTAGGQPGRYAVGSPGPGDGAPGFTLASTTGQQVSLSDYAGSTVLLYFQEGLTCQPCWDQLRDLEQAADRVHAAGIDAMLAITSDPIDLITRKVRDDGLTTPTLSDPDLAVSRQYTTNQYGMMGESRNGHTFILVGPDGVIRWRADYGGAPDYTMYVPVGRLLADLQAGRRP